MITKTDKFQEMLENAKLKWVINGLPSYTNEGGVLEALTLDQMIAFQSIACGSKFGEAADSVSYLIDRDAKLRLDEDDEGYLGSYCLSGYMAVEGNLHMWYESTSGMFTSHSICGETGESYYEVSIADCSRFGVRHTKLQCILSGATLEQWKFWDDWSVVDREANQTDWDKFYTEHLVPLGWPIVN